MSKCIPWIGNLDAYGYGRKMINYEQWKAHRIAWVDVLAQSLMGSVFCIDATTEDVLTLITYF